MKRNLFFKAMTLMLGMATSSCFTACGDDDDDEIIIVPDTTVAKVEAYYGVSVNDDYSSLWDIEATYTTQTGTKTEKVTDTWTHVETFTDAASLPSTVQFAVVGKPKQTPPTLDSATVYKLSEAHFLGVKKYNKDGQLLGGAGAFVLPEYSTRSVLGAKLTDAILKDRSIVNTYESVTSSLTTE
jgi:hypothetical protein